MSFFSLSGHVLHDGAATCASITAFRELWMVCRFSIEPSRYVPSLDCVWHGD
jgi:hypothetical protein